MSGGRLDGRVALVTGAGSGIGRASAELFAREGAQVVCLRDHPNVLIGSTEQIAERLRERRETLGVDYVTVPRTRLDDFAPVVAELTGT